MINFQGIDGGLLTIGKFDLLDSSLSLPCDTLVVIEAGFYPVIQPRKTYKCTTIRFRGQVLYQQNKLQDHLMLPSHLQPNRAYGVYVVELDKDNVDKVAYILADLDQNIAVISQSFYQLCRYAQDFDLFKINGILLNQSSSYSQQSPRLNLSEELLGHNLDPQRYPVETLYDFGWGDDFTPSIIAHVDRGETSYIPFGEQYTGSILGVGNYKTWRVTAFKEVPVNHLTNIRHLVLDVEVTQIRPRDLLCNTVTTPEYLDFLINQHQALGSHHIQITSETRGGLPIYINYNIETDDIEECVISYNPLVLQDYLNSKFQKYLVVNTAQEEAADASNFEKNDRYENANVSLKSILAESQLKQDAQATHGTVVEQPESNHNVVNPTPSYSDGEYNPDQNVLSVQKTLHSVEANIERDRLLENK